MTYRRPTPPHTPTQERIQRAIWIVGLSLGFAIGFAAATIVFTGGHL